MVSVGGAIGSEILPEGFTLQNMPNDLFTAIEQATRVISWQENLTSDECPPRWMWHLDWELETWFEKIKIERERKYGSKGPKPGDPDYNDEGDAMFEENVYFERLKRGEPLYE